MSRRLESAKPLVLTGPVHSGKTTFLFSASIAWKAAGVDVGGFLSVARPAGGPDAGYDLVDLRDGQATPFIRRTGGPGWPAVGPWTLDPDALARVAAILRRDAAADVVIVDEVGPLELDGGGLWPSLAEAFSAGARCLCVVRDAILEGFLARFEPSACRVFPHGSPGVLETMTAALASVVPGEQRRRGGTE